MAESPEYMLATQAFVSQELSDLRRYVLNDIGLQFRQHELAMKALLSHTLRRGEKHVPAASPALSNGGGSEVVAHGTVVGQMPTPKVSHAPLTWSTPLKSPAHGQDDAKISPFTPLAFNGSFLESEHGSEALPEGMKYMISRHWQSSKVPAESIEASPQRQRSVTTNHGGLSGVNLEDVHLRHLREDPSSPQETVAAEAKAKPAAKISASSGSDIKGAKSAHRASRQTGPGERERDTADAEEHEEIVFKGKGGMFGGGNKDVKLDEEFYDVKNFYKDKGVSQAIARSDLFEKITLGIIAINAVYIGVDADNNFADTMLDAALPFQIMDNAFCLFFTFELAVRFLAFKRKFSALKDKWFVFDSFLVILMVLETWVLTIFLLMLTTGGGSSGSAPSLPTGPLRLLRLLRLSRLIRLLRSMPELITLISGMKAASRGVGCALMLIIIINYVFAIILNMFLRDIEPLEENYGTLGLCMWTLALDGTFMDSLKEDLENLRTLEKQGYDNFIAWAMILTFVGYVLLTNITVMNMLIGIVCEVVSEVKKQDEQATAIQLMQQHLRGMLCEIDTDGDDKISRDELGCVVYNHKACQVLRELDVEPKSVLELTEALFEDDEDEGREASVTREELLEVILKIRGNREVNMEDLISVQLDLRKVVSRHADEVMEKMQKMTELLGLSNANRE
eukprot:TRINITY_DN30942_c0_g1_i1.p1 TRINITY_DN30942_c0_g1~~TRINITY_DN30942_c0_g1_i1.p1  ORF type:complete len:680 (-),score=162.25 TRINITY_DN30942_c0_g1_i1:39-2078(-)